MNSGINPSEPPYGVSCLKNRNRHERSSRLIVKARPQLLKRFLWEVVYDDGSGRITTNRTSPVVYETMEAAYEKGQVALADIRTRHHRIETKE